MAASLKSRFPQIIASIRPRVSTAIKESAERIEEGAKELVPRDSEDLYHAIHVERKAPAEYAVVAGNEDVFYGHMVEFGSSASAKRPFNIPPRPFIVPAAEAERALVAARVTAVLRGL